MVWLWMAQHLSALKLHVSYFLKFYILNDALSLPLMHSHKHIYIYIYMFKCHMSLVMVRFQIFNLNQLKS